MIPSSLEDKSSKTDWKKVTLDLDSVDSLSRSYPNPVYLLMSDVPSGKKIDSYENFFTQDKPAYLRRQASFGKRSKYCRNVNGIVIYGIYMIRMFYLSSKCWVLLLS